MYIHIITQTKRKHFSTRLLSYNYKQHDTPKSIQVKLESFLHAPVIYMYVNRALKTECC